MKTQRLNYFEDILRISVLHCHNIHVFNMHCDTCTTDHHHDYNYMKPSHDFLKYRYVNDCIFSALSGWMVHVPVWRDHVH